MWHINTQQFPDSMQFPAVAFPCLNQCPADDAKLFASLWMTVVNSVIIKPITAFLVICTAISSMNLARWNPKVSTIAICLLLVATESSVILAQCSPEALTIAMCWLRLARVALLADSSLTGGSDDGMSLLLVDRMALFAESSLILAQWSPEALTIGMCLLLVDRLALFAESSLILAQWSPEALTIDMCLLLVAWVGFLS